MKKKNGSIHSTRENIGPQAIRKQNFVSFKRLTVTNPSMSL